MTLKKERVSHAARVFARSIRNGSRVGLGSSEHLLEVVKAIRERIIEDDLYVEVVPSTMQIAHFLHEYKVPLGKMRGELDVCVEVGDRVDSHLNFVKTSSHSLIRDKSLALNSRKIVVLGLHPPVREKLNGIIPFEVNRFALANTVKSLSSFGGTYIRIDKSGHKLTTEDSNYLVNVDVASEFDVEDVDEVARKIPGVLETGVFMHLADEVILVDKNIEVLSAHA